MLLLAYGCIDNAISHRLSMKRFSLAALAATAICMAGLPVRAYDSTAHANAAMMITAACTWWQLGQISRGQIMSFAQQQYREKYGSDRNINWNTAINIANKLDKQKGLGCMN